MIINKILSLASYLIGLAVLCFYAGQLFTLHPEPTDDLFYIDAAYSLQAGEYSPPSARRPQHHYLRWPVFLPLAAFFKVVGYSEVSVQWYLLLQTLLLIGSAGFLLYTLFRCLGIAFLGSLCLLAIPPAVLGARILSEPIAVSLFFLGTGFCVLWSEKQQKIFLLAAASLLALLPFASVSNFYALPLPFLLLLFAGLFTEGKRSLEVLVACKLAAALFLFGCVYLALEVFFFSGDPLLRYKVITKWHLHHKRDVGSVLDWFSADNQRYFLFGFVYNFGKQAAMLTLFWMCSFFVAFFLSLRSKENGFLPFLLASTTVLLFFEFFAFLAFEKIYVRIAAPALAMHMLFVFGFLLFKVRVKSLLLFLTTCLLGTLVFRQSQVLYDPMYIEYFRQPVLTIVDNIRQERFKPRRVRVIAGHTGEPGLMPFKTLIPVYSKYLLPDNFRYKPDLAIEMPPRRPTYLLLYEGSLPEAYAPHVERVYWQDFAADKQPFKPLAVYLARPVKTARKAQAELH